MKRREIRPALDALRTVKMTQIEDKELRNRVISDHLKLLGEQRKFDSEVDDLRTVFLDSYKKEQDIVQRLNERLRAEKDLARQKDLAGEINQHSKYLDAVKEYNERIDELGNIEIEIEPIDMEKFIAEYQKQDYDMGVVEALYPMFM